MADKHQQQPSTTTTTNKIMDDTQQQNSDDDDDEKKPYPKQNNNNTSTTTTTKINKKNKYKNKISSTTNANTTKSNNTPNNDAVTATTTTTTPYYHYTLIPNNTNSNDHAIIFLHKDLIPQETESQIKSMLLNPAIHHARIMPDCHVGAGCCVGFTCRVEFDKIVPSYIGGDIGCGILTYPLEKTKLNLKSIEKKIKYIIPMGNGHENIHTELPVEQSFMERYLLKAHDDVIHFMEKFATTTTNTSFPPTINFEYFVSLCKKIDVDVKMCIRAFGTLGGGNHYIEINQDSTTQEHYCTIHSGSRSFGMKLFEFHNSRVDGALGHLNHHHSIEYCIDMIVAQRLAQMNRHIMLALILRELDIEFNHDKIIESTHNYVDFGHMVLRKGAISAQLGEFCIVSLNMRDGILICQGKGNEDWNFSSPHGCGRNLSRSEARRRIKFTDYKLAMQDVISTSVCQETLDEAPQAYKDKDVISEALEPTATIIKHLPAVANLKGVD
jgi:tRNA-splicing ligase RtcB